MHTPLFPCWCLRNNDGKRCPMPFLALKRERSALQFHRLLDDCHAQPCAGYVPGIAGPVERLKQPLLAILGNTYPKNLVPVF